MRMGGEDIVISVRTTKIAALTVAICIVVWIIVALLYDHSRSAGKSPTVVAETPAARMSRTTLTGSQIVAQAKVLAEWPVFIYGDDERHRQHSSSGLVILDVQLFNCPFTGMRYKVLAPADRYMTNDVVDIAVPSYSPGGNLSPAFIPIAVRH